MAKIFNMRRNRKGQFVATGGRSHNPKRKKTHHRKNYMGAGALIPMNPPRRRSYKRNSPAEIAGLPVAIPEIGTIAAVLGGVVGPNLIQNIGASVMSAQGTQQISPTARTLIKVASYAAPPAIGYLVGGRTAMKTVIAAEIATALAGQVAAMVNNALASVTPAALSGYTRPQPRMGMLAGYTQPRRQLTGGNWANRTGVPAPSNMNASRFRSRYHN